MDNLIEVKQLPIIEENLRNLAAGIDEKVSRATSLVCSVETYKDIKAVGIETMPQDELDSLISCWKGKL